MQSSKALPAFLTLFISYLFFIPTIKANLHPSYADVVAPVISGNQNICSDDDPIAFTVTTAASGTGTITYQWQDSNTDCTTGFTDIAMATNDIFDPPPLSQSTFYRVIAIMDDGTGTLCRDTSNCLTVTVQANPMPSDAFISQCIDVTETDLSTYDNTVLNGTIGTVAWYDGDPANGGSLLSPVNTVNLNTINDLWAQVTENTTTCTGIIDITTTIHPLPIVTLSDPADVCIDGSDLNFTATPTGGTFSSTAGGFSSDGAAGTATIDVSTVGAGTYDVTYIYTDANGCQNQETVSVTINPLPIVTLSDPADACVDESDLNFTATPAGGLFTSTASGFSANGGAGTALLDVSVAGPGTYTVTYNYTDSNGCQAAQTVSVTIDPLPVVNLSEPTDVCIDGTDRNFTATPTGGTFSSTASGLIANGAAGTATLDISTAGVGTHEVTYTYVDANGCQESATVDVVVHPLPTPVDAPFTICPDEIATDLTYHNSTILDGDVATVTWYDGDPSGSSLLISNPSIVDLHTVSNLYARVTTIAGGCITDIPITINHVTSPSVACNIVILPECNSNNGSIDATGSGGLAPYSYIWSNGVSTATNTGVGLGNYSVTISDANGCTATCDIAVDVSILAITTSIDVFPTCAGGDGKVTVLVSGGNTPYIYNWDTGASTASISNLEPNNYNVTVTDAQGCSGVATAQLQDLDNTNLGFCVTTDVYVANYSNNTITYYDANTGAYEDQFASTGLSQPNSILQIGDTVYVANGGSDNIRAFSASTGASLGVAVSTGLDFPEQMAIGPDGYLYVASQSNGDILYYDTSTFPFTYQGAVTTSFTRPHGIAFDNAGNLYVSENTDGGRIIKYTGPPYSSTTSSVFHDYPAGQRARGLYLGPDGNLYANVIISGGARVEEFDLSNGTGPTTFVTLDAGSTPYAGILWGPDGKLYIADFGEDELHAYTADGTLSYTVTDNLDGPHGVYFIATPTDFDLNCNLVQNPTCADNDGTASVSITGGAGPFCYSWSNGASTSTINNLAAGTYTVTVIDNNGCAENCSVTLTGPEKPVIDNLNTSPAICGNDNGNITVSVSSGTAPYTYAWDDGAGTSGSFSTSATSYTITSLSSGVYNIIITDSNSCTITGSVGVVNNNNNCCTNPDLVTTSTTICEGENIDLSTLVADNNNIGGTTSYYTNLTDANNQVNPISNLVMPLLSTKYYIREDTTGCADLDSLLITVETQPTAGTDGFIAICEYTTTPINLTAQLTGADAGGTWTAATGNPTSGIFNAGAGTFDPTGATDGTYIFTYAFAAGATCLADDATATVVINPAPEITLVSTQCAPNLQTYSVTVHAIGNTVSSSQAGATITNLSGNNYEISGLDALNDVTITITNATGCANSLTVTRPDCTCPTLTPPVSGGNQTICEGEMNPTLTATVGTNEIINWYDAATNGNLLQSNSNIYTPNVILTTGTYTYYAEAENSINGCISDNRTTISIIVNTQPNISARDTSACPNQPIDLATLVEGTALNTLAYGTDANFTGTALINPATTTTYYVRDSSTITGCVDTAAIEVTILDCCKPKICLPVTINIKRGKRQ